MNTSFEYELIRFILNLIDVVGLFLLYRRLPKQKMTPGKAAVLLLALGVEIILRFNDYHVAALLLWGFIAASFFYVTNGAWSALYLSIIYMVLCRLGRYLLFGVLLPASVADTGYALFNGVIRLGILYYFSPYMPSIDRAKKTIPDYIFLLIAVCQMLFFRYIQQESSISGSILLKYTVSVMCIGTLSSLYVILWRVEVSNKESEITEIETAAKRQYDFLTYKTEADEKVARQYHDIRQQLNGLYALTDNQEFHDAIRELTKQTDTYKTLYATGNKTIDVLLMEKAQDAQARNIDLNVFMDCTEGDFIHRADLCAMIGNALDNAIEAASKLGELEKRRVIIKSTALKGFLIIRVQNYYAGTLIPQNGLFASTKENPDQHGRGLSSICHSAKRYQGECRISTDQNLFVLEIFIPLPKRKV